MEERRPLAMESKSNFGNWNQEAINSLIMQRWKTSERELNREVKKEAEGRFDMHAYRKMHVMREM